uniref:Uncharacterized protein n=1 Tax=Romanomermis culicivorax TaxID=13658 RepID=A0A915I5X3_ROMCU
MKRISLCLATFCYMIAVLHCCSSGKKLLDSPQKKDDSSASIQKQYSDLAQAIKDIADQNAVIISVLEQYLPSKSAVADDKKTVMIFPAFDSSGPPFRCQPFWRRLSWHQRALCQLFHGMTL